MIYCVSFFGVFFAGVAIDLACGPEPDPYDYYVTFFHNNLQKTDGYQPFYFSGYTFMNGYLVDVESDSRSAEADINVKEWMTYMGRGVSYKDVSRILYETDRKTDSLYLRNFTDHNGKIPDSLKNNSFIKKLVKRKNAMAYMALSKKTEPLISWGSDYRWETNQNTKSAQHTFALKYLEMAAKQQDRFLKLRCFYQAQRLLHYSRYYREAADLYDKHIRNVASRSHVKYWALNLKAGEEQQMGHSEQAAYLYSRVFALCPERRARTYVDFFNTKVSILKVIKLAKNGSEKAVMYAIKGFRTPGIGLTSLKKVYAADRRSDLLSVLLAREINKVEEHYLTPRFNGRNYFDSIGFDGHDKYDSVKTHYTRYIPKLKAFCEQLADDHKYPEPALGYLGSAYLSWVTGDTKAGLNTLNRIDDTGLRPKLYDEKQLIKLLLFSQGITKIDSTAENELLPLLLWLEKKVIQERSLKINRSTYRSDYDLKYYSASARDFYEKVLAPLYARQRDSAMAALCILHGDRTILTTDRWAHDPALGFDMPSFWQTAMHSADLKKILEWNYSTRKTPFLKLLMATINQPRVTTVITMENSAVRGYYLDETKKSIEKTAIPAIYDLLGTACLREHKYNEAVKAFQHVGSAKLEHSVASAFFDTPRYANPFKEQLGDYPWAYQAAKSNKLIFAIAMAKLQKQIKTDPKNAAVYYYKMATGMYNTSWYGSAWYYTAYSWSNADIGPEAKHLPYNGDYLGEITAKKYFLKARALTNDMEFKAKCTFMAAKCDEKHIPIPADYINYLAGRRYNQDESTPATKSYDREVRQNPYFKSLRSTYSKTQFYKLAVNECSYFRDFLSTK